jgi:hypothetical protein
MIKHSGLITGFPAKPAACLGAAALALSLAGCGGGDGESNPNQLCAQGLEIKFGGCTNTTTTPPTDTSPTITTAEGFFTGTITGSPIANQFTGLILETGDIWMVFATGSSSSVFSAVGFAQGAGSSSSGTYTSSNLKEFVNGATASAQLTATYMPNVSIQGTINEGAQSFTFGGTSSTTFYNEAATLPAIAGGWSVHLLSGTTSAITVAADGTFTPNTSVSQNACTYSGKFTPRASGKNVFDLTVTWGAAPCAQPGGQASGIAVVYPTVNGGTQLIFAGVDATHSFGDLGLASR